MAMPRFHTTAACCLPPNRSSFPGAGLIGVWARADAYHRLDEFSSGGIGPHEILRLPSGNLAVANGGIRTHPETGRKKLNLDTMRPNLTVLSPTGGVVDVAAVPGRYPPEFTAPHCSQCRWDGRVRVSMAR